MWCCWQLVAPLDIDAIHKAEKEAKRTKVFLLRNAGLPICPRRLPYMSSLREVDLSSNRIVEMPFDIGELHKLRILNLSYNFLASLPPSIGDLVILRQLNVAHNVMESLPEQVGELKRLEVYTHTRTQTHAKRLSPPTRRFPRTSACVANSSHLCMRGQLLTKP